MPQGPIPVNVAIDLDAAEVGKQEQKLARIGQNKLLIVGGSASNNKNLGSDQPMYIDVKSGPGRVSMVQVLSTTGSQAGTNLYDARTYSESSSNVWIAKLPSDVVGKYYFLDWPFNNGLCVNIGPGIRIAISYE